MNLEWAKCPNNQWCNLLDIKFDQEIFNNLEGVYIIWHGEPNPGTVYVGQGVIRDRLKTHQKDPKILAYQGRGLFVTWAKVSYVYSDGIERFLAMTMRPKVRTKFPKVKPIRVNMPW